MESMHYYDIEINRLIEQLESLKTYFPPRIKNPERLDEAIVHLIAKKNSIIELTSCPEDRVIIDIEKEIDGSNSKLNWKIIDPTHSINSESRKTNKEFMIAYFLSYHLAVHSVNRIDKALDHLYNKLKTNPTKTSFLQMTNGIVSIILQEWLSDPGYVTNIGKWTRKNRYPRVHKLQTNPAHANDIISFLKGYTQSDDHDKLEALINGKVFEPKIDLLMSKVEIIFFFSELAPQDGDALYFTSKPETIKHVIANSFTCYGESIPHGSVVAQYNEDNLATRGDFRIKLIKYFFR
jgi:hypothetical protein